MPHTVGRLASHLGVFVLLKPVFRIAHSGRSFRANCHLVDPPAFAEFKLYKSIVLLIATLPEGKALLRWQGLRQDDTLTAQVEIPQREHGIWIDRIAQQSDTLRRQLPSGKVYQTDELSRLASLDPAKLSTAKLRKLIAYSTAADAEFLRQVSGL